MSVRDDRMQRTTLFLPLDLRRRWAALSQRTGKPQSAMYREAMQDYLSRFEPRRPESKFIGKFRYDDSSFSAAESEKYLAEHWVEDVESGRA